MSRDEIIPANPIVDFVRSRGHELKRAGENFITSACPVTPHKAGHRPCMIYPATQSWSCHDCGKGGSVIDWIKYEKNVTAAEAMRELGGHRTEQKPRAKFVCAYDYTDERGRLLFQVCRTDPKDFYQRRPNGLGGWIMSTAGVRRVLYRLPEVIAAQSVIITEGEKDADNLAKLSFVATTNCGGKKKWRDEYSETLRDKDVIVIGDNDEVGREHVAQVIQSLTGIARSIKNVILPGPFKDASDFIASVLPKQARRAIEELIRKVQVSQDDSGWATDLSSFTSLDEARFPTPLEDAAYYGLAGKIVQRILPETEADPAALLFTLLAGFGNMINRAAYMMADGARHHLSLFVVTVGRTSISRKRTAWVRVKPVLELIDEDWARNNVESGLSSGEGVIHRIRDKIEEEKPIKEKGRYTDQYQTVTVDPGVDDKRLFILETEFCSPLKVMNREGNTLSPVLRAAWDGDDLGTLTKNSRERATKPHLSMIGHITREELRRNLDETEAANGFGNRILWIAAKRSKSLPKGGRIPTIDDFSDALGEALLQAQTLGELKRDDAAEELWAQVYPELSDEKPGLLGAIIGRAAPQVLRVSGIYAVLDCSSVIRVPHLKAALACWRYSEASARWIFETGTGNRAADRILVALIQAGEAGLTKTQIVSDLFHRNVTKYTIDEALRLLHRLGLAERKMEPTEGRYAERWFFKGIHEINEQRGVI